MIQIITLTVLFVVAAIKSATCSDKDQAIWAATLIILASIINAAVYAKNYKK